MPHGPTAEQVIEEWAAMVERLYRTATPTASTDPGDERAANEAAANLLSGHGGLVHAAPPW